MTGKFSRRSALAGLALLAAALTAPAAEADTAAEIDAKANLALNSLLANSETAQAINEKALAVLVFPDVVKAGFGVGGLYGEGVLIRDGVSAGYYNVAAASFGLQLGAQSYSQFLYFMTEGALNTLTSRKGFEIGGDANVAVVNEGVSAEISSMTIQDPIVAFVTSQKGLMAGVTIEGSKITEIDR
ncbi:YSC84-related protein [Amaricoccus tamworthensis]|uniref:lipid-binding SYLF domain-containing protein n=1 Tax=Amaricoccus tamworthensis TaxID=57002 RepID=UPI003C7C02CC